MAAFVSEPESGPIQSARWSYPPGDELWLCCIVGESTAWHRLPAEGQVVIGSDEAADLVLDEGTVAPRHALLRISSGGVTVESLQSFRAVVLNSIAIEGASEVLEGDWLVLGKAMLGLFRPAPRRIGERRVLNRQEFLERTREEVDRCHRYGRTTAVISVVIEPAPAPASQELGEIFDFFRQQVRSMDIVAYHGDALFAVILPEVGREGALAWVARFEKALHELGRRVSVDIVVHPESERVSNHQGVAATDPPRASSPRPVVPPSSSRRVVIESASMRYVYDLVDRAASSSISVLVLGETGAGKEVVAEAIHERSARRSRPLISVNCAALPESLIEGELFGVERGAFTGSDRPRAGLIEQAAGGTLLLDEVGDIPLALQPKLLRALQEKSIRRLGSTSPRSVDFRLIAATNRNLESMVAAGTFREDLYFRLSAFTIPIPPLRERREDICGLIMIALRQAAATMGRPVPEVSEGAMRRLQGYSWPGNVRQLFNVVERALVLEDGLVLHENAFPEMMAIPAVTTTVDPFPSSEGPPSARFGDALQDVERKLLLDALQQCDGNQTRAAELLAMPRRTLVYKLRRLGIRRGANHE